MSIVETFNECCMVLLGQKLKIYTEHKTQHLKTPIYIVYHDGD